MRFDKWLKTILGLRLRARQKPRPKYWRCASIPASSATTWRAALFPQLCPPEPAGFTFARTVAFDLPLARPVALDLLADAKVQHARVYDCKGRGTKKSYRSLIDALERALDPEKWARIDAEAAEQRRKDRERWMAEREAQREPTRAREAATKMLPILDAALAVMKGEAIPELPASSRGDGLWIDPGARLVRQRLEDTPARFHVGQAVRYWSPWLKDKNDGARMAIVEGYGLHAVTDDEGPYVHESGRRISYQWGYVAQAEGGARHFYPAYKIQALDYEHRYLRFVADAKDIT